MSDKLKENILIENANFARIPCITLKDYVIYPNTTSPVFIARKESMNAIKTAKQSESKSVFFVAQKTPDVKDINISSLFSVGTLVQIEKSLPLPDNRLKIFVKGNHRARLNKINKIINADNNSEYYAADITLLLDNDDVVEFEDVKNDLLREFNTYVSLSSNLSEELFIKIKAISDVSKLVDNISFHVPLSIKDSQEILDTLSINMRVMLLVKLLKEHNYNLKVNKKILAKSKHEIEKHQKEYFLRQKLKTIQDELKSLKLGSDSAEDMQESDKMKSLLAKLKLPKYAKQHVENEIDRYANSSLQSQESGVIKNYIDWLLKLPWLSKKRLNSDLKNATKILDEEHYGLEEVKERIIEYLVVHKHTKNMKGAVLCLVGPPGVGKTSLAKSIARSTGRTFVRFSLGGVRDEAEIRGHRRTYLAAMPGKILQKMAKAKTSNPLFLLDEIDKIGNDFRGDPASALLEVLDPEQNATFNDHYLEVDYDLSDVMFVCTANTMDIAPALADRLEIIRLSGYTEQEKFSIAKNYLWSKQLKNHSVRDDEILINDSNILSIIRYYTHESGIRGLNRQIEKIVRKSLKSIVLANEKTPIKIDDDKIKTYLGVKKYNFDMADKQPQIGQINGLAWTSVGGELLTIEVITSKGKGKFKYTGNLGNVMQESMETAISHIRAKTTYYGLDEKIFKNIDIHIHVPNGATPKDGPSAGLGITIAILSALLCKPIQPYIAMTGEITLKGKILKIGGLKEKILAAVRVGIKTVIIPKDNEPDLVKISKEVLEEIKVLPLDKITKVAEVCLELVVNPTVDTFVVDADSSTQINYLPPA